MLSFSKLNIVSLAGLIALLVAPLAGHAYSSAAEINEYLSKHNCQIVAKINDNDTVKTYTRKINDEIKNGSKSKVEQEVGSDHGTEGYLVVYRPNEEQAPELTVVQRTEEDDFYIRFELNKLDNTDGQVKSSVYIYTQKLYGPSWTDTNPVMLEGITGGFAKKFSDYYNPKKQYSLICI
jgi:hypothetical protein